MFKLLHYRRHGAKIYMARPINKEYRTEILNAFDKSLQLTIKEVHQHVTDAGYSVTYQATRRILQRMCKDGLISELPRRAGHIVVYTKLLVNNHLRFVNYEGETVSLLKFIDDLTQTEFSPIFSEHIQKRIKSAILDYLAGHYEEPYKSKGREAPDVDEMKRALNEVLNGTRLMHMFIKQLLQTPVDQERLIREFKTSCAEQHAAIVDRTFP